MPLNLLVPLLVTDVDAAAREATLAHVVRRDDELCFADGVVADRLHAGLAAGRARGRETEQVVVHGAVDLDVVVAVVAAGDAQERIAAVRCSTR